MDNKTKGSDKDKGLYKKYEVSRTDGKPVGDCIVLEFKDENARVGILAFANAVHNKGYTKLSKDLFEKLVAYENKANEEIQNN